MQLGLGRHPRRYLCAQLATINIPLYLYESKCVAHPIVSVMQCTLNNVPLICNDFFLKSVIVCTQLLPLFKLI